VKKQRSDPIRPLADLTDKYAHARAGVMGYGMRLTHDQLRSLLSCAGIICSFGAVTLSDASDAAHQGSATAPPVFLAL
jgi:hypothetical protein